MLACTIEQGDIGDLGNIRELNRRAVVTFNEHRHPSMPVFSLSLSCNHCGSPACMTHCPAAAITKDVDTGAVIIDGALCLGCKYCTWACPYDAPRYNESSGTVEKCDFCITRLRDGEEPACVRACPTEALGLGKINPLEPMEPGIPGFTNNGLHPAIRFKPLRDRQQVPHASAPPAAHAINSLFASCLDNPPAKITLKAEWILLVFTSMAFILTAWFAAYVIVSLPLNSFVFVGLGSVAMALSTIHLGKKQRAYRAIFNLRHSWLSREIFLFSAFLGLGGFYLFFAPPFHVLGWVALSAGFFSLFAIDRIYQVALHIGPANFHSAHVLFNGLYLAGFLTGHVVIFAATGFFKLTLYLQRKYLFKQLCRPIRPLLSGTRILLGFILPASVFVFLPGAPATLLGGLATVSILIGEIIDRTEYYQELDIITPRKQMRADILLWFNAIKNK